MSIFRWISLALSSSLMSSSSLSWRHTQAGLMSPGGTSASCGAVRSAICWAQAGATRCKRSNNSSRSFTRGFTMLTRLVYSRLLRYASVFLSRRAWMIRPMQPESDLSGSIASVRRSSCLNPASHSTSLLLPSSADSSGVGYSCQVFQSLGIQLPQTLLEG